MSSSNNSKAVVHNGGRTMNGSAPTISSARTLQQASNGTKQRVSFADYAPATSTDRDRGLKLPLSAAIQQQNSVNAAAAVTGQQGDPESQSHYSPSNSFHPTATGKVSEVENLAQRIEDRRDNRLKIPFSVRKKFLIHCRDLTRDRDNKSTITTVELIRWRDQVQRKVKKQEKECCRPFTKLMEWFGFHNEEALLLELLNRGIARDQETKSESFYFQDFAFYFTVDESHWPFLRNPLFVSSMIILGYYIATPILFCSIMRDQNVCPDALREERGVWYAPWLNALYFASATLSTVGYGDVSVYGGPETESWRIFIGALYMIASMIVLVTAFAAALDTIDDTNPLDLFQRRFLRWIAGPPDPNALLHQQVRRVVWLKLSVVIIQFAALNLFGMFVARAFVSDASRVETKWSWMTTFYWSIQTTTTVGYGDLTMPFEMRWFQVFYLVISTYFVGDALGRLGSLGGEVQELKRQYAWERREVSKGMLEDMQAEDHDDKIDQYEFLVASLLQLEKISSNDISPIMDRFRQLAGPQGWISVEEQLEAESTRDLDLSLGHGGGGEDGPGFLGKMQEGSGVFGLFGNKSEKGGLSSSSSPRS